MSLKKLDIYNVRNIVQTSIQPSPAINFIYGVNASGKSSFLEAIYFLGRAKSFRTVSIRQVNTFSRQELIVTGQAVQRSGNDAKLGIEMDGKNTRIRINRETVHKRSELAYALPLQLIHPTSYQLLDGGPKIRREFIDWGVFNQQQEFLTAWRKYRKALQQRNGLLKKKLTRQIDCWNQELVHYGAIVTEYREDYLQQLQPVFIQIAGQFLQASRMQLRMHCGWDVRQNFLQTLESDLHRDIRYGFTHSGPHRADFQLLIEGRLAREFVSRGQLKLLVLALKLSQVKLLEMNSCRIGCILIDDLTSELDSSSRAALLKYLTVLPVQIFITATELKEFGDLSKIQDYRMFHVEQGKINQA